MGQEDPSVSLSRHGLGRVRRSLRRGGDGRKGGCDDASHARDAGSSEKSQESVVEAAGLEMPGMLSRRHDEGVLQIYRSACPAQTEASCDELKRVRGARWVKAWTWCLTPILATGHGRGAAIHGPHVRRVRVCSHFWGYLDLVPPPPPALTPRL